MSLSGMPLWKVATMSDALANKIICIRGAGEMASAVAWRLHRANFHRIYMLEVPRPLAVRRRVSFCEAVYDGHQTVEGIMAVKTADQHGVAAVWEKGHIAVLVDPKGKTIADLEPDVIIDAILAKRNLGTRPDQASLVVGLGPGFEAGRDVHAVIETNRGHNLGRIITRGRATPNTGIPGRIAGFAARRVLRSPGTGRFQAVVDIGHRVAAGDAVGRVNDRKVCAQIDGILRGLVRSGTRVEVRMKLGDIDPRGDAAYCETISDKARAISGSVLEVVLRKFLSPSHPEPELGPLAATTGERLATDELADRVAGFVAGRIDAMAAAMREIENRTDLSAPLLAALRPHVGGAHRIGVTGPPGVGKSTFISRLVKLFRSAGSSVGVIAVDPSSPASGGALLGDRLRMDTVARDSGVFIRSMATRGTAGGLAGQATGVADVLDAAGKVVFLFETVGVGQTEFDIATVADTVINLSMPGTGDVIQGMKSGLMEIGDIFIVHKADLPGAAQMQTDLEAALSMRPDRDAWKRTVWLADSLSGTGLEDIYNNINAHWKFLRKGAPDREMR